MTTQREQDQNDAIDAARMRAMPCGCPDCDDGIQPGHFACTQPEAFMLAAERDGRVVRAYEDGAWHWFIVE